MFYIDNYHIISVDDADISYITGIYNSNIDFLKSHLGVERVSDIWVAQEYQEMREIGFLGCKIVDAQSQKIVGFLDFSLAEETYLSLLMIDGARKNLGIGHKVLRAFEEYAKSQNSQRIRIDVVISYDDSVLRFWQKNGFVPQEELTLRWHEQKLPAVKMIKVLA